MSAISQPQPKAERKTAWLTYDWDDNTSGDVDYYAQQIRSEDIAVELDRYTLKTGIGLWDQIGEQIMNPELSDAWLFVATQKSLGNPNCQEEFRYAHHRALQARGSEFPLITMFPGPVDKDLIPPGIRVRLYVSLQEPDWIERVRSGILQHEPNVTVPTIEPYELRLHTSDPPIPNKQYAIEIRPRADSWSPFFVAIPLKEKDRVVVPENDRDVMPLAHAPRGKVPWEGSLLFNAGDGLTNDEMWWFVLAGNEATPTMSYFLVCQQLPSEIRFGVYNGTPQYRVTCS
jgi:hypothetical protein